MRTNLSRIHNACNSRSSNLASFCPRNFVIARILAWRFEFMEVGLVDCDGTGESGEFHGDEEIFCRLIKVRLNNPVRT